MKRILYFNPDQNRRSEVRFLSDLAKLNCTIARTEEELLNWLRSAPDLDVEFDCILVGLVDLMALEVPLYSELIAIPQLRILHSEDPAGEVPVELKAHLIKGGLENLFGTLGQLHHR